MDYFSAVSADQGHFCLALVAGQRQILSSGGEIFSFKAAFELWRSLKHEGDNIL